VAAARSAGCLDAQPILVVIDGAMALRRAVDDVFDHPVMQPSSPTWE